MSVPVRRLRSKPLVEDEVLLLRLLPLLSSPLLVEAEVDRLGTVNRRVKPRRLNRVVARRRTTVVRRAMAMVDRVVDRCAVVRASTGLFTSSPGRPQHGQHNSRTIL